MKKKFFSMYNHPGVKVPVHDFGPSVTQPDESLTIQQILARVSQGLTTGIGASVSDDDYDDPNDDDFDDPTLQPGFDKLDALQIETSQESDDLRKKVTEEKRKKKMKQEDEEFKKKVDEEIQRRKAEEPQE